MQPFMRMIILARCQLRSSRDLDGWLRQLHQRYVVLCLKPMTLDSITVISNGLVNFQVRVSSAGGANIDDGYIAEQS